MTRSRYDSPCYRLTLIIVAVALALFFIFRVLPGLLVGLNCTKYANVTGHPTERTGMICRRTDTGELINTFNNKEISHEKAQSRR